MRGIALILAMALLAGCGGEEESPTPVDAAPAAPAAPAPTTTAGRMQVVDLEGRPLANMAPVATRQPNAFDKPVATGPLTGPGGATELVFPSDERLYLRAWDPELNYFPNNFYEALPGTAGAVEDMVITMVPSATLRMQLFRPDGQVAAGENVGLMMFHPTRGPWWPAEGNTDADGMAGFSKVPAGSYVLRVKIASGEQIEVPERPVPPGVVTDLGAIALQ